MFSSNLIYRIAFTQIPTSSRIFFCFPRKPFSDYSQQQSRFRTKQGCYWLWQYKSTSQYPLFHSWMYINTKTHYKNMKSTRDYIKQENSLKHNASMHEAYSFLLSKHSPSQSPSRHLPPRTHTTWGLPSCHPGTTLLRTQLMQVRLENGTDFPDAPLSPNKSPHSQQNWPSPSVLRHHKWLKNPNNPTDKVQLGKPVSKRLSYFTFPCVFWVLFWATYT